jgi:hypothetical protein
VAIISSNAVWEFGPLRHFHGSPTTGPDGPPACRCVHRGGDKPGQIAGQVSFSGWIFPTRQFSIGTAS